MRALLVAVAVTMITGCSFPDWTVEQPQSKISGGVVLHGCNAGPARLENTNSFPVRIRRVWLFRGETTLSVDLLGPGEQLGINLRVQDGFHILTADGIEVGWLNGECLVDPRVYNRRKQ